MTFLPRLVAGSLAALCAATSLAAETVRCATGGFGLCRLVVPANEKGYFKDAGIDAVIQTHAAAWTRWTPCSPVRRISA